MITASIEVDFYTTGAVRASPLPTMNARFCMICLSGEYIAYADGKEHVLSSGDELYVLNSGVTAKRAQEQFIFLQVSDLNDFDRCFQLINEAQPVL